MSDFDNFFAKKLGEEGNFPRRDKNWKALSKRLDAFDSGLQHNTNTLHRNIRYWQAAAACAVMVTGWLAWKTVAFHRENEALREEIALLQDTNRSLLQSTERPESSETLPDHTEISTASSLESVEGSHFKTKVGKITDKGFTQKSESRREERGDYQVMNAHALKETDTWQNDANPNSGELQLPLNEPFVSPDSIAQQNISEEINSAGKDIPSAVQTLPFRSITALPLKSQSKRKPELKHLPLGDKPVASSEMIKPAPNPSRFRAGIQLLAGSPLPKDEGVSWLTGHGASTEYRVWRNFWMTASADWLRCDVASQQYLPKYYPPHHQTPDPPHHGGGGPSNKDLVQVESTQRRQELGLGLRYAFPWHFWVRPSLSIQHTWVHTTPQLISFKYEQPPHNGGPHGNPDPDTEYIVQETDAQFFGNVWKFGAGLERETRHWVFGLRADYSNNFAASDRTFDALIFKAGIQYKIN